MSKNSDETVRLQSEKTEEWIREIRGERLQGIAEGASSAPRLASSSATSFPRKNECPGTHCILIEQERQNSSCQICHKIGDKRKVGAGAALARRKRNRAVCPEHQIMRGERVKVGKSRTLARERKIRTKAWRGKGELHGEGGQIPRRKGRASKKSLPKRSRRKHERVSGRKSSPGRSAESWPHSQVWPNLK